MIKNLILFLWFTIYATNLQAQSFSFEYWVTHGLRIKPFKDSSLVRGSSNFSGLYSCQDSLTGVMRCLLGGDYGKVKIRGQSPKIYLELNLVEPIKVGLDELLSNKKKQQEDDTDSLSLVRLAIRLLEREYNFTVKEA